MALKLILPLIPLGHLTIVLSHKLREVKSLVFLHHMIFRYNQLHLRVIYLLPDK